MYLENLDYCLWPTHSSLDNQHSFRSWGQQLATCCQQTASIRFYYESSKFQVAVLVIETSAGCLDDTVCEVTYLRKLRPNFFLEICKSFNFIVISI